MALSNIESEIEILRHLIAEFNHHGQKSHWTVAAYLASTNVIAFLHVKSEAHLRLTTEQNHSGPSRSVTVSQKGSSYS